MFAFNNFGEMPQYLNRTDFDLWFIGFISYCDTLGLNMADFHPNLEIEFSDDPKEQSYGSYSIDEIKDMIRQKWDINQEIEGILKGIKSYEDYRHRAYDVLAGAIRDNNKNAECQDIKEEIDGWFDNISFSTSILGEYVNAQKKIILYTKNIENDCLAGRSNKQNFEKVFVHELFHAYHYCPNSNNMDLEELVCRYDYTCKVVKESLASAFEWYYCTQNGIPGADELIESWNKHSIWTYPYAGANNLLQNNWYKNTYRYSIIATKLKKVLDQSMGDMDGALRILLPKCIFYDLKNAIEVQERIKTKTAFIKKSVHFFKLSQRNNFVTESKNGYAFASDMGRYADLKKVHTGDVVLSLFGGKLWGIGIAKSDCYSSNNSHGRGLPGLYVDIEYFILPVPISITCFKGQPCYPIERREPYVRAFDYPDFIRLVINEAKALFPDNSLLFTMVESLL